MIYSFRCIQAMSVAACVLCTASWGKVSPSAVPPVSKPVPQVFAWTVEPWGVNSQLYYQARMKIYQAVKAGQNIVALSQTYKVQAQKNPHDPLIVFKYVYATYQASQVSRDFGKTGALVEAEQALDLVLPTHTYEFARLHFLVAAATFPRHQLKDVGARLLKHDPSDIAIEWRLVTILDPGLYPAEKDQALAYAFDLVKRTSNSPDAQTRLAATYYQIWMGTKEWSDGEKAIAAYRVYLNMAPKDAPFRKRAQSIIDGMPAIQAYWNKKKGT